MKLLRRLPDSLSAHAAAKGWCELIDAGVLLNPRLAHTPIETGPPKRLLFSIAECRKRIAR
jgi:hypothetical protein